MCAIIGALVRALDNSGHAVTVNNMLTTLAQKSRVRGRDGFGFTTMYRLHGETLKNYSRLLPGETVPEYIEFVTAGATQSVMVGNLRAEPTTEYVAKKQRTDQQPYELAGWSVVHNGTIANDKELRTNELLTKIDSAAIAEELSSNTALDDLHSLTDTFKKTVKNLRGSFAILATHAAQPNVVFVAANYRPIWYVKTRWGMFFGSTREVLSHFESVPKMLDPYSIATFRLTSNGYIAEKFWPLPRVAKGRALVVCSGGLDSVVAATYAKKKMGYDVELIHFKYGSRAERPEVRAIEAVANELDVKLTLFPLPVYKKGDSPLLDHNSKVAGGEAGAEFAHEWVPARNLLLLSVATAYAEANGFDTIILGNNLEEAGAYPDNEPEFIARFNDLLPFAVADGKAMQVLMPVGNLMKHEIVALGHKVGAPLHLTWSCYRAGSRHCGRCGPCYMRRTAFEINNLPEVIEYEQ